MCWSPRWLRVDRRQELVLGRLTGSDFKFVAHPVMPERNGFSSRAQNDPLGQPNFGGAFFIPLFFLSIRASTCTGGGLA